MYRNIFGCLGHSWIDEYPLNELRNLPDCYVVEVTTMDKVLPLPIKDVTGFERNVAYVQIYYKSKVQDKSPYMYAVNHKVTAHIIEDFR